MTNIFTVHELAGLIGVTVTRIGYAEKQGYLPAPAHWQGRKVYDQDAVSATRRYFDGRKLWTKHGGEGAC